MRICIIASLAESLVNFRGELIRKLVSSGHEVIACAPDGPDGNSTADRLREYGVRYYPYHLSRTGTNPLHDLRTLVSLTVLLRTERPDIVFSYTVKPVVYGSVAARLAGVPSLFSMITGLGYAFTGETIKQRVVNFIVSNLYRLALCSNTGVFFQNPDDLELFKESGLLRAHTKTMVINGSGVDLERFAPESFPDEISFLLIARLLRDKGIVEYAGAAAILRKKYPHIKFKLVGWLDENPACITREELHGWTADGTIEYGGRLDDVRPAISASSVYVLPSYREGTPRTVLEAMAMGRPIITTDAPGCRETVTDGDNGFLVPVKNVAILAETMEKFILNPGLIEKMGKRSREIVEEKYDVHKVNADVMKAMGLVDEKNF